MSSISPVDRIMQALRTQALQSRARPAKAPPAADPKPRKSDTTSSAAIYLTQRVRAIGPDDPARRKRAFRTFLEAGLLNLFGEQALADAAFQKVIDQVQDAMQSHADLAGALDKVADILLSAAHDEKQLAQVAASLFKRSATA